MSNMKAEPNVVPMADIMLVLLIIFMITTPLLQEGIMVNLAQARTAQAAPEVESDSATTVTITRDRRVYLNSVEVPEDEMVTRLSERLDIAPDLPLFIRSDAAANYGTVVTVVNMARDAGYERIGLLVDRQREGG